MKEYSKRNPRLDFARVMLMLFVIGIHTPMESLDLIPTFRTYYFVILFSCDAAFFTLSGYFLLQKKFTSAADYRSYYYSRFVTILFPILIFHFILDVLFHRFVFQIGVANYLKSYAQNLVCNDYQGYLWFMYFYIPLVIFAPFISKMLNHMSKKELLLLLTIVIVGRIAEWYINSHDMTFNFGTHLISAWTMYFILGHYLYRFSEELHKFQILFYIIGIIALKITCSHCVDGVVPGNLIPNNYYMVFIFCLFVFLLHAIPVDKFKGLPSALTFVAKHSFTVYLTHFEIIEHVKNYLQRFYDLIHFTPAIGVHNVINVILNILCSIAFAAIIDELIIFRLQGLLRRHKNA